MENCYKNSAFISGAKDAIQDQFNAYKHAMSVLMPVIEAGKKESNTKIYDAFDETISVAVNLHDTAKSMIGHINHFIKSGNFPTKDEMNQSIKAANTENLEAFDTLDEYIKLNDDEKLRFKFVCVNLEQVSKFLDSSLEVLQIIISSINKLIRTK